MLSPRPLPTLNLKWPPTPLGTVPWKSPSYGVLFDKSEETTLTDINFKEISPVCGGHGAAFEELCCQLAHRTEPEGQFVRLRGDGGDGGIECYVQSAAGKRGWQAKYVFDPSHLVKQASNSFRTALDNHPDLSSFILCFPFNPTGKTRRGKGGIQKLEEWRAAELDYTKKKGRRVEIEFWPASELLGLIIEHDCSGGMRIFFFNTQILSDEWFKNHLELAQGIAGRRYTPELNVSTDIAKWFAAFGRTDAWSNALSECLKLLHESLDLLRVVQPTTGDKAAKAGTDPFGGTWPGDSGPSVAAQAETIKETVDALQSIKDLEKQKYLDLKRSLKSSSETLRSIEVELSRDLERKHGKGVADSPGWRQHMAEWQAKLPAENLDSTRGLILALDALVGWLDSPSCALGFETAFVLTGSAGSGKTHGVCDIALQRHQDSLRTCLIFGHLFGGEPDAWTRIGETLGLAELGRDRLLDAMNSAGEATGRPLVICIDAINETKPLSYWRDRLIPLLQAVHSRPFLRICVVCRTPYLPACLPENGDLLQVEHQGFKGRERDACRSFCEHYGLKPFAMIIPQPEVSNPLYLRLICRTAHSRGLDHLPESWAASVPAIEDFLCEEEQRFARRYELSAKANTMRQTLSALVDYLVAKAVSDVPWSTAIDVVLNGVAGMDRGIASRTLEWLVSEGLLIDDAPPMPAAANESMLRPAFERLGDFLVADAILKLQSNGPLDLTPWIGTIEDVERHSGVLGILSALLPELRNGLELPDMTDDPERSEALLALTVDSLPSRPVSTFSDRSKELVLRALGVENLSFRAMEGLVSIAWRRSPMDAHWLHDLLRSRPLAERDGYWCAFLHKSFDEEGAVVRLIDAAFELALDELNPSVAERWAKMLLWFTAAADRRVKDRATRAAIAVVAGQLSILPNLIETMLSIDDDAVVERLLLTAYGALLHTRHQDTLKIVVNMLHLRYTGDASAFSNALIRDHIRAICELAVHLGVLPPGIAPEFASKASKDGAWPLPLPPEEEIEAWSDALRFWPNELRSDFFKYSMWPVERWSDGISKADMAKWMLQTVAQDFLFMDSPCVDYDRAILHRYGGGRGKPVWAERIGKKYTWMAMYQLTSRLHDSVEPKKSDWEPDPIRAPFILPEGRHLDPSLPHRREQFGEQRFCWKPNLNVVQSGSDGDWILSKGEVPRISQLVGRQSFRDQDWQPLVAHLNSGRPNDRQDKSPYRHIWIDLYGYLVRPGDVDRCFEKLNGRNFLGRWMPEGLQFGVCGGFAVEYPWATPFDTVPDQWYSDGRNDKGVLRLLLPAWNDISSEWQYDGSMDNGGKAFHVPARPFFEGEDLWWSGRGSYKRDDGRTVFLYPSLGLTGSALFADSEYLAKRLKEMDRCLIWALLGEKQVLGGFPRQTEKLPINTFSQVACMDAKGAIQESELVFFDDPNSKTGIV